MKTLREALTAAVDALKLNTETLGVPVSMIDSQKYGTMPTKAPAILLFVSPLPGMKFKAGTAHFDVFCLSSNPDAVEATLQSFELAEKVSDILSQIDGFPPTPDITFDRLYGSMAASCVEFNIKFKFTTG